VRLLLISFYFPPAGGGGVQRALKFCQYLPEFGVDVHVLAPEDSKWLARDEPLVAKIPSRTVVHRAPFRGPAASLRGEALHGKHGLERLTVEARHLGARLLVPDKALPWIASAVPAARRIVREHDIDVVMTTSPPHSVQLTGAAVAAATGVPWVADFRDPWLGFLQRRQTGAAIRAKRAIERRMARLVAARASAITTVTDHIAAEIGALHPSAPAKTTVIENGSDFADFEPLSYTAGKRFVIVHAGSFFGGRTPRPFLLGLRSLFERRPELRGQVIARFVGDMLQADREWASGLGIDDAWQETGFLPYDQSIAAQRGADAVLLLIEEAEGRGLEVPCGKLWEYLASQRPILAAVPPDGVAARLVRTHGAGVVADGDDAAALSQALEGLVDRWANGGLADLEYPTEVRESVSRRAKARQLADVLHGVAG
jgi:glycosyltransferase involved in cell wall biosynthesis